MVHYKIHFLSGHKIQLYYRARLPRHQKCLIPGGHRVWTHSSLVDCTNTWCVLTGFLSHI